MASLMGILKQPGGNNNALSTVTQSGQNLIGGMLLQHLAHMQSHGKASEKLDSLSKKNSQFFKQFQQQNQLSNDQRIANLISKIHDIFTKLLTFALKEVDPATLTSNRKDTIMSELLSVEKRPLEGEKMLEHLDELVEKFIHTKSESLAKLAAREEQLKGNYDQSIVKLDQQLRHYIKVEEQQKIAIDVCNLKIDNLQNKNNQLEVSVNQYEEALDSLKSEYETLLLVQQENNEAIYKESQKFMSSTRKETSVNLMSQSSQHQQQQLLLNQKFDRIKRVKSRTHFLPNRTQQSLQDNEEGGNINVNSPKDSINNKMAAMQDTFFSRRGPARKHTITVKVTGGKNNANNNAINVNTNALPSSSFRKGTILLNERNQMLDSAAFESESVMMNQSSGVPKSTFLQMRDYKRVQQEVVKANQRNEFLTQKFNYELNQLTIKNEQKEKLVERLQRNYDDLFKEMVRIKEVMTEDDRERQMKLHATNNKKLAEEFNKTKEELMHQIKVLKKKCSKFALQEKKLYVKEKAFEIERADYHDQLTFLHERVNGLTSHFQQNKKGGGGGGSGGQDTVKIGTIANIKHMAMKIHDQISDY